MREKDKSKFLSPIQIRYLKIVIGIIVLLLFLNSIEVERLKNLFSKISTINIIVLICLTVLRNVVGSIRFKLLINGICDIKLDRIMGQYFIASLYNNFLPTAIGGDAVRMVMLTKEGLNKQYSSLSVVLERIIGFYALLIIGFFTSFFWQSPGYIQNTMGISLILYTLVLIFGSQIISLFNYKKISKIIVAIKNVKFGRKKIGIVFLISLVYQLISIYISYYMALSIGINDLLVQFLTLVPIVWFFTMVPFSFGGLGIREISFAYLFGLINISPEESTIISLGTYFTLLASGLIGVVYLIKSVSLRLRKKNPYKNL